MGRPRRPRRYAPVGVAKDLARTVGPGRLPPSHRWLAPYLDLLQRWLTEQPDRVLRSYHTSSRVPPNPLTDPHKVWKYLAAPALDIKISLPWVEGIGNAQQLQNSHWTSFTARDLYLIDGEGQDQLPLFIDAHHTTPAWDFRMH